MFLRRNSRTRGAHTHAYWSLVETYRTARGPRQRVIAYLGDLPPDDPALIDDRGKLQGRSAQMSLFADPTQPQWASVDVSRVRVERSRAFGAAWVGSWLLEQLGLPSFFDEHLPRGKEQIEWGRMAEILILARLCDPGSELSIAERWYPASSLPDLLGVPVDKVNDDRLYRALDKLRPLKNPLEQHLRQRFGELFKVKYDLLLYDVTSTFFEGQAGKNEKAKRGHSRDQRSDCKQVCIALVVTREGLPLSYEVFDGNRADSTTVETIVTAVESRHGKADRIWVMDRGMVSESNLEFLRRDGRRYIVGTPKNQMRQWEAQLASEDWSTVRDGLEVKLCAGPSGEETFILCRSADRVQKERSMREQVVGRMEAALTQLKESAEKRPQTTASLHERIGRLKERYSRASKHFDVRVVEEPDSPPKVEWDRRGQQSTWAELSEGCYVLRSNISGWSADDLWKAYIQLTQAEAAFRIQKDDLRLRPVWHQTAERVEAHILVCFLAFVLWKTLGQFCRAAGLGDCPRKVLDELAQIQMVDVVLPTRHGPEIRLRCVSRPEKHQATLLQRLRMRLPDRIRITEM